MTIYRRVHQNSAIGFFTADWRFLFQWFVAMLFFGIVWTVIESFGSSGFASNSVGWKTILATHLSAVVLLMLPSYLFILTGKALRPLGSDFLQRLISVALFGSFAVFVFASASSPGAMKDWVWAQDGVVASGGFFMAAAVALLLGSTLVVCYRFVAEARSSAGAIGRLLVLGVFAALLIRSPTLGLWFGGEQRDQASITKAPLRLVLVLREFDFSSANIFFSSVVDETMLAAAVSFRPIALPAMVESAQLGTLFTGLPPYEHGLRVANPPLQDWDLFLQMWSPRMAAMAASGGVHVTNRFHPSSFHELFASPLVEGQVPNSPLLGGTLCPERGRQNAFYAEQSWIQSRLSPFMSQALMHHFFPTSRCAPLGMAIEDVVHEEIVSELGPLWSARELQEGGTQTGVPGVPLLSIWSLDLDRLGEPLDGSALDLATARGQRLARLLNKVQGDLRALSATAPVSLHVIGLSSKADALGSYFALSPGTDRLGSWPLADENRPLPLGELLGVFEFPEVSPPPGSWPPSSKTSAGSNHPVAFYLEHLLLEEHPTGEGPFHRAVSQRRSSRCLFWDRQVAQVAPDAPSDLQPLASGPRSADVAMLLYGQIDGLTGSLEWSQPQRTDLMPVSQTRREHCELAIFADLQRSIDRDVHLLEPYKLDQPVSEVSAALNRVDQP